MRGKDDKGKLPWVETSRAIMNLVTGGRLKPTDTSFTYGVPAVRVCEHGMSTKIDEEESIPLQNRLHGSTEGVLEGHG